MKIKIKKISFDKLKKIKGKKYHRPIRASFLLTKLINLISKKELKDTNFTYKYEGMENLNKKEPCLILMNHSAFIDLKIFFKVWKFTPFNIVCTDDGFINKDFLMRHLGCIPTVKFQNDPQLVSDMYYAINKLHDSILMFPEATYSFDGTNGTLPDNIGKLIKFLKVPLIIIKTEGAYLHDPLYNNLKQRKINVRATIKYKLSKEEIKKLKSNEIENIVKKEFTFNNWDYQFKNNILISEDFRAEGLNRILYKCPHCNNEGTTIGKGIYLTCSSCNKKYELLENGHLKCLNGDTIFDTIPKWYEYEKECVKKEILEKTYKLDLDVDIYCLKNYKAIYHIGKGHLTHTIDGFTLKGNDNDLYVKQGPLENYSLYSDYYWYEIDDIICICDKEYHYYCVPKNKKDVVAKARLAAEEIYKLKRNNLI